MPYTPIDIDSINWEQYFNQQGSGKYFVGEKYMRGYGILGNIGKFLLPIAKNLAETVGTEGLAAGTRIMKDVAEGKELTEALKEHSKQGLQNIGEKVKQCGKGRKKQKPPFYKQNKSFKTKKRKLDQLDYF